MHNVTDNAGIEREIRKCSLELISWYGNLVSA